MTMAFTKTPLLVVLVCSLAGCLAARVGGSSPWSAQAGAPGKSSGGVVFDLKSCLGKSFAPYERTLGRPVSTDRKKGEIRTYKSAALKNLGIAQIVLSSQMTKYVDWVEVVYSSGADLSWQKVASMFGIDPSSVTPVEAGGTVNGRSYQKTLLSGIAIPGVSMSSVKRSGWVHFGKGFGVSVSKGATEKYPSQWIFEVEYVPYDN